jgi:hypothetical protein
MTSNQSIIPMFGDKQNFIPFHEEVTILWCASHKSRDIKIDLVSFKINTIFSSQVQLVCLLKKFEKIKSLTRTIIESLHDLK